MCHQQSVVYGIKWETFHACLRIPSYLKGTAKTVVEKMSPRPILHLPFESPTSYHDQAVMVSDTELSRSFL